MRLNCPDEEAGILSYLQLYYCKLDRAKPLAFIILVVWLSFLFSAIGIAASDFFCINLSTIASILGMSESMTGVTFLAFGNGSPDVFSTFAAMKTHSGSLAVGELIGAAGFITAVVAGSMALVRPFKVARKSFVRDISFFIVAASFSMVFLADGHLDLWECAAMVGFYVFYVLFVVIWHWVLRKRSMRRSLEETARSHFHIPGTDEGAPEPYHDDEDENVRSARSRATTRTVSFDDFANLERGGSPVPKAVVDEIDANDETRDRYLAEISSNMRVNRRRPGERRNTVNPIRPSLVGALEFRAVLSSLEKSRNIQTIPLHQRRYSDDPTYTLAQQSDRHSIISNPEINYENVDAHDVASDSGRRSFEADQNGPGRVRAVSANDALGLRLDPQTLRNPPPGVPQIDLLGPSPPGSGTLPPADVSEAGDAATKEPSALSLSPSRFGNHEFVSSPMSLTPQDRQSSGDLLALPNSFSLSSTHPGSPDLIGKSSGEHGKPQTPKLRIPDSSMSTSKSSPHSPFPTFFDDPSFIPGTARTPSIRLPPPSLESGSTYQQAEFHEADPKPLRWWPYKVLPPPTVLLSTLFPTLYSWRDKNIWEKALGIVAAPSILLFVVTLPTVETEKDEDDGLPEIVDPDPGLLSPENHRSRSHSYAALPPDSPKGPSAHATETNGSATRIKRSNTDLISPSINITAPEASIQPTPHDHNDPPPTQPPDPPTSSPRSWNRWLLCTQLVTAPFFIVLILWANTSPTLNPRDLLLPTLYSLIASLICLLLLLLFTSPDTPPRHRHLICYLGFIVSIAWISTIANEVVGVLKALGTILNISDAILGLTIFAVGNSLGDLVADITVARLGYPVMALSACFGGPMLNILLGIGLGGCYMTILGAKKRERKHPGSELVYKPYQIEVGGSLLISGVTLLVTLAGLLVVVPMRGWWMDRRVGWGLVAVWGVSTVGNVVVEVVGWGRDIS